MTLVRYPGPGCVVEFMQGNKPVIAWVLEEQNGKLRLLTQTMRETKLQASRLLPWSGPQPGGGSSRQDISAALNAHEEKRQEIEKSVNAIELWEFSQGEVHRASAEWFAELLGEAPDADTVAAVGRALLNCKTHFKFQPPEFDIYTEDKVEARLAEQRAADERERLVSAGLTFFKELWQAHTRRQPSPAEPPHFAENGTGEKLRGLLMRRIAMPDDHETQSMWKAISKALPPAEQENPNLPLLLAQAWGIVPAHYNHHYDRAGYAPGDGWSEEFRDEIEAQHRAVTEEAETRESAPWPFVSIDAETTRDIDDAFHAERREDGGYTLRIALACPAYNWDESSPLGKAVSLRATSVYLPEGNSHMLPEALGTGLFSLHAGTVRPSLVLCVSLGSDGSLEACTPEILWVAVGINTSYTLAEACIEGEDALPADVCEQVRTGHEIAGLLRERRLERGAVIIDREDPDIILSGEGAETRVELEPKHLTPASQLLVSEMMILANSAVSAWAAEHGVPLLHRTQNIALPREHSGVWSSPEDIARVVKALGPALLEPEPKPHASLGVPAYCPITSPLRRYTDFLNLTQVLTALRDGSPRYGKDDLERMLPLLSARLDAAGQVQRFRPRYWKLLHYKQKGEKALHSVVVTEENQYFVSVSLPEAQIFLRGPRKLFGDKIYPGQRFAVRLGKIDPLANEIQILEALEE